jgi:hypothetical protein
MFVWCCAAVRQYGGFFFIFFLTLALSDPASSLIRLFINIPPTKIFNIFSITALYSFFKKDGFMFSKSVRPEIVFLLFIPLFVFNSPSDMNLYLIILELFILAEFLKIFFIALINAELNVHNIVLIIYELTIILKYILVYNGTKLGIEFFISTSILEIFIGIFFVFIKENNPKFIFKLPKSLQMD